MSNFVFYDFETSSSNKYWGQIIQIGAILTNDNLEELDRFDARCRLNPGIIPEAMALIVNKSSPKISAPIVGVSLFISKFDKEKYLLPSTNGFYFQKFFKTPLATFATIA